MFKSSGNISAEKCREGEGEINKVILCLFPGESCVNRGWLARLYIKSKERAAVYLQTDFLGGLEEGKRETGISNIYIYNHVAPPIYMYTRLWMHICTQIIFTMIVDSRVNSCILKYHVDDVM